MLKALVGWLSPSNRNKKLPEQTPSGQRRWDDPLHDHFGRPGGGRRALVLNRSGLSQARRDCGHWSRRRKLRNKAKDRPVERQCRLRSTSIWEEGDSLLPNKAKKRFVFNGSDPDLG